MNEKGAEQQCTKAASRLTILDSWFPRSRYAFVGAQCNLLGQASPKRRQRYTYYRVSPWTLTRTLPRLLVELREATDIVVETANQTGWSTTLDRSAESS